MSVYYGTMTSKGQTTVPAEIRAILNLHPGDRIRYVVRDGEIVMKAKNKRAIDLKGRFHDPERETISTEEMEDIVGEAIATHVAERS
ncbi:type II toxin-antitoxin system PrlF family antitoxin [Martelella sp. AD-3]|uniref:AbrB/MazE/SpoVT family DNA-binding domain-containing protein n=1 Tax=Martelella sp. AD-3 TaxID=686597 RepID=UPI0004678D98|nr:type II toxin-antitoxin system PrlF family antitoxin [Martelella sp. AD-3]AMM85230.1 regulator [Martelella sp. AD-3]MAM10391.1 AbrB/MazE/SpoVT family DNA-binding domain-containing protein [Rhizobiaceae bacterium]|tara:strand:+ start:82 stop:342 length:261 start_codon:yes stop_codon:yes gene_type:complete